MVGELLAGRAFGDHRPDPRISAGCGEGLLTAHRLTNQSDLAGVDAGLAGQVRDGRGDVPITPPAEVHRVPAGQAVTTSVEQQRAVAVPGQLAACPITELRMAPAPGSSTTAAPLRGGMYQAGSRTPSAVRKATSR